MGDKSARSKKVGTGAKERPSKNTCLKHSTAHPTHKQPQKQASKMVPPVQVSSLIKTARWSALLVGVIYGKTRYDYLKPIAEEEKRVEAEEKKIREEQERIAKQLAEANEDTILK
ncbi:hypothetical protein SKAU_G00359200 [Synaphobranchus kaupii]|uniref:ATP synthase F(0) complex subunit e, mitochondrial n=1 Tax=Synaphobranchus kaupii TaxID=118154 RepID=A0A9Q1IGY3_SYNKA|nr:hypothetical protein SKAU_G00359200 [Synaphobranchus kaupii]